MNCSKCGTYIADGWRFCKGCGSEAGPHLPPHQAETIPLASGIPRPGSEPTLVMQNPPWDAPPPPTAETVQSPWTTPPPPAAPITSPNVWPLAAEPARPRRGSVLLPILIVAGLLVLGAGTVLALYLTGVVGDKNSGSTAGSQPGPVRNENVGGSTLPTPGTNVNSAPPPTPTPVDPTAVATDEVTSTLNAWADSIRRRSLSDNVAFYADHLDVYYGSSGVSSEAVRANRAQIFSRFYDSTEVQLSNISVEVSPDATHATITYDNAYDWRGGAKTTSGRSHNKMIMDKTGGRWLITSEIHLSQY